MQRRYTTLFSLGLLAAAAALPAARAQQPYAPPPAGDPAPMTGPAPTQSVSDEQLQKFVDAAQKVASISREYSPKVRTAPSSTAQEQLQNEADGKMVAAVKSSGLTVDEFNGIGQAIQEDPGLKQRARDMSR